MATPHVRHKTHHAVGADVNLDAVRLHENGVAYRNVEQSDAGIAVENEKPGLTVRIQAPGGNTTRTP